MEALFISIISAIIINRCTARISHGSSGGGSDSGSYSSSSSSGSTVNIAAIIIPVVVGSIILVLLIIFCKMKCAKRQRMGILPLSTQIAVAQQENQYAPPSYSHLPPYGQPPPYEQLPPYSAPSAPMEPTKAMFSS
jgi:hypothetical protein